MAPAVFVDDGEEKPDRPARGSTSAAYDDETLLSWQEKLPIISLGESVRPTPSG